MTTRFKPSRRSMIRTIAGLALAAVAASASAQQALTKVRFQLDWRFEGPAALFLLPAAKGYFKEEGLDVTIDAGNGSAGTVNRVASGVYDLGFADTAALIEFLSSNQQIPAARLQAVFMLYDYSPAAVFALKKSGIAKPADLNGKTLGAPVFDSGRKAFPLFVKANNLDAGKIKWQSMEPALRETMLARGEIDAITGFYFTSLLNLNARGLKDEEIVAMPFADNGVKLYGNAIISNPKFIQENPKAISAFLRALSRGVRDVIADPEGSVKYVKDRDALIDVPLETKRLKLAIASAIATPDFKSNGIGAINKVRLEDNVVQISQAFGLKVTPDPDQIFNSSFLPSRSERQVFAK